MFLSKREVGKENDLVFLCWLQFVTPFFTAPEERNPRFNWSCSSLYICVWQWMLSPATLPARAAAIWAQWRCWHLRAVKRSQQSNACPQISAIPRGKIMLWGSLFYPPLTKGNMLTLPLWKWSWKIFEVRPWTRCGTPCPKSWWPFAQLVVYACDCHVLSQQGLPFAIRCYKWSVLNQAFLWLLPLW